MPSHDDRRAVAILLCLAAAGLLARFWTRPADAPGAVAYRGAAAPTSPSRDSLAARALRLARPLGRDEQVDVDRAPADELTRLPHVGPGLAARIVADREAHGPFGSLAALDRVPGIGPTVLKAVEAHVTFSATPLAGTPGPIYGGATEGSPLIRQGPGLAPPERSGRPPAPVPLVTLNTATEEELVQLPGIGPGLARAIVADRAAHGPYRALAELDRVKGIGAATIRGLKGRVRVP